MRPIPKHGHLGGLRRWIGVSLALAVIAWAQAPAQAQSYTFAGFTLNAGAPLNFTNQTTGGTLSVTLNTQVNFNFTSSTGQSNAPHAATLSLSAVTNAGATTGTIGGTTYVDQSLNGSGNVNQDVLKITDNATGKNLLTMTFTGDILGKLGDNQGSITGSTDPAQGGNVVTYSSDYLTFIPSSGVGGTGLLANSFALAMTSINPGLTIGAGGFLNSFTSAVTGSFTASTVPEPASIAMFGTGILATIAFASQRKRLALFNQNQV
jgi:hypothetical protein